MSQVLTSKYPISNYTLPDGFGNVELDDELELMEFIDRIQRWQIDLALTHSVNGALPLNGTPRTVYVRSLNQDGLDVDNVPANERDLVIDSYPYGIGGTNEDNGAVDPGVDFQWNLYSHFQVDRTAEVETAWWIHTLVELSYDKLGVLAQIGTIDNASHTDSSAVDCQIYGHPVSLFENASAGTWTGTLYATPIAWWARQPTSGGDPVFDSATGAQINPNVVID